MTYPTCQTVCITDLPDLEERFRTGLLSSWEDLMDDDPASTFYQGPAWCMEWYRSYNQAFSPFMLLVTCEGAPVGLVPLATENATGRLTFATDNMADYRDVVSQPEYRTAVVAQLLTIYQAGSFPNTFRLGPTQPESTTVDIIRDLTAQKSKLRSIARTHPCWRLSLSDPDAAVKATTKKSVRRRMNHYERQGPLLLQHIRDKDTWDTIKFEFFEQHSRRQVAVGRPTSFNEERKQRFYDALIEHHPKVAHITTLHAGPKFIAGHYGYLWRNVLYWGASTFDVKEQKHSPGQVLVALLVQDALATGLNGIDFTLGTEEFKARFSNRCVNLPSAEIYSKPISYLRRRVRDQLVGGAKAAVTNIGRPEAWNTLTGWLNKRSRTSK